MKYLILLMLTALAPDFVAQETCAFSLTGTVKDEHDERALPFSEVRVLERPIGFVANQNGVFIVENLCVGEFTAVVSHIGCDPDTISFIVNSDTAVVFYLEHHAQLLKTLTIEAKQPHKDIAARVELSEEDLSRNAGEGLADMLDDLQGMQVLNTGSNISKPMLHGMHSNRLVIMSDNAKLQGQQWGSEHAPELDPMTVERLEVVQGASSLRYGTEAMAGAIIAHSSDISKQRKLNGSLQSGFSSNGQKGAASASIQGALFKKLPLFFSIQGSAINAGDLRAPDYYLENTGKKEWNGGGRLLWKGKNYGIDLHYKLLSTELGILSYSHIGNLSDLQRAIDAPEPLNSSVSFERALSSPRQLVQHELTSAKIYWKPNLKNEFQLNVSRQYNLRQEFDRSTFSDPLVADLQYEITTYQADVQFEDRISSNYKYEIGIASETQANTYTGRFFIPNFRNYSGGLFTIHHWNVGAWELEGGVRYDYKWQQAFMYRQNELYTPVEVFDGLSWNFGISHEWKKWVAMFNAGRAWRSPSINELYSAGLHHGIAAVEFGDETLEEERMTSLTLSVSGNDIKVFGIGIDFNATGYTYFIDNYIYLQPTLPATLTIRGAFPTFNFTSTNAFFRGIDANARLMPLERLDVLFGVELVMGNDLNSTEYLVFIPPNQFDSKMNFKFWNKGHATHKLGVSWAYTTRQNRVPAGVDYAPSPDGFALIGAEISGNFIIFNQRPQYSFRAENALNTSYRSYLNRLRYYADEPGRNFIITLKIPF
jgi:iron complex outermembrane receptor protein